MQRISLVNVAHNFIGDVLSPGDIAIDATVGNGFDTLFLIEQVSPSGKVFGFDIQEAAINSAWQKIKSSCTLTESSENITLLVASHADMAEKIPVQYHGNIRALMFNLGYLPGGNKSIITRTESTITALNVAIRMLSSNGIISILAYPGHVGGDLETEQVTAWCEDRNQDEFKISVIFSHDNRESAPRLFVIRRRH
jgi:hypothetical protein